MRIEERWPRICGYDEVRMAVTDVLPDTVWWHNVEFEQATIMIDEEFFAYFSSSQSNSMGQRSWPVKACSNPRSHLFVGDNGTSGFLSSSVSQLMTAGFRFAASSPRAPDAPFRSCHQLSQPEVRTGKKNMILASLRYTLSSATSSRVSFSSSGGICFISKRYPRKVRSSL